MQTISTVLLWMLKNDLKETETEFVDSKHRRHKEIQKLLSNGH